MIIMIIIIFKNVRGCQSASFGMSSFGSYSDRSLFVDSVIFLCVNGYVSLLARLFPPKKEVCYPNYGCFKPQKYLKHPQSPSQAGAEFNLFTEKNIFWSNFWSSEMENSSNLAKYPFLGITKPQALRQNLWSNSPERGQKKLVFKWHTYASSPPLSSRPLSV